MAESESERVRLHGLTPRKPRAPYFRSIQMRHPVECDDEPGDDDWPV